MKGEKEYSRNCSPTKKRAKRIVRERKKREEEREEERKCWEIVTEIPLTNNKKVLRRGIDSTVIRSIPIGGQTLPREGEGMKEL